MATREPSFVSGAAWDPTRSSGSSRMRLNGNWPVTEGGSIFYGHLDPSGSRSQIAMAGMTPPSFNRIHTPDRFNPGPPHFPASELLVDPGVGPWIYGQFYGPSKELTYLHLGMCSLDQFVDLDPFFRHKSKTHSIFKLTHSYIFVITTTESLDVFSIYASHSPSPYPSLQFSLCKCVMSWWCFIPSRTRLILCIHVMEKIHLLFTLHRGTRL